MPNARISARRGSGFAQSGRTALTIGRSVQGSGLSSLTTLAAALLITSVFARHLVRRGRSASGQVHERPRIEALAQTLYVEAMALDRSVGTVKGFAIASACREHRRGSETYLLVDDPAKPAAVWVKDSEIRLRRFLSGRSGRTGYES